MCARESGGVVVAGWSTKTSASPSSASTKSTPTTAPRWSSKRPPRILSSALAMTAMRAEMASARRAMGRRDGFWPLARLASSSRRS